MKFDVFQEFFVVEIAFLKGFFDDIRALRFAVYRKFGVSPASEAYMRRIRTHML